MEDFDEKRYREPLRRAGWDASELHASSLLQNAAVIAAKLSSRRMAGKVLAPVTY